jgi:p-hydroxybenzoate 3-monooxygenase
LRYTDASGARHEITCDAIAGCDGFHGICRPAIPPSALTTWERDYPYAWLGILADVPPSTDELIYAHHAHGFALHSLRSPTVSRLYLQVDTDEDLGGWPDDRIWAELARRFELPGWALATGPVLDKNITPMRSFVSAPMRYGRLFLAGDAAHIVPPTGAKGLNLALADVAVLAPALDGLLHNDDKLAAAYSATCLERVWRSTHFSWWMTTMLHRTPGADAMASQLQLSQLRYVVSSRAAATSLAENYTGFAFH